MGSFFSISCRQTGHFFCHISIPVFSSDWAFYCKYSPPTYEARVIHSLAGTILIDSEQKRLTKLAGHLMTPVEFGYGLLGRSDTGTVELGRVAVGPQQWKTTFINIRFSGRAVIFKTINKEQYERRSDFHAVSSDLSLADAKDLLISRLPPPPQTP